MKFGGIGIPELVIILVVVLLIFGPKNLPKIGSALGKTVKNLRDGMGGGSKDVEETTDTDDSDEETSDEKKSTSKKVDAKNSKKAE